MAPVTRRQLPPFCGNRSQRPLDPMIRTFNVLAAILAVSVSIAIAQTNGPVAYIYVSKTTADRIATWWDMPPTPMGS